MVKGAKGNRPVNVVHMPKLANPEDYEYVGALDTMPSPGAFIPGDYRGGDSSPETFTFATPDGIEHEQVGTNYANAQYRFLLGLVENSPSSRWSTDRWGQCDHCGAALRYVAILQHRPTGHFIAVGETCLTNRFDGVSKEQFDAMRKASAEERALRKIKAKVEAYLASVSEDVLSPLARVMLLTPEALAARYPEQTDEVEFDARVAALDALPSDFEGFTVGDLYRAHTGNAITVDIRRKFYRYGDLSEAQAKLLDKLARQEPERRARRDAKAAEVTVPVPEGRHVVEGVVLSTRWEDGQYGSVKKILVLVTTPAGNYRLWGSAPKAIRQVQSGAKVRFMAEVERSERDEAFGFYHRPTQAELVEVRS